MTRTFDAPGPGYWERDLEHAPLPITRYLHAGVRQMFDGMAESMALYGIPLAGFDTALVAGRLYGRARPVGAPPPKPGQPGSSDLGGGWIDPFAMGSVSPTSIGADRRFQVPTPPVRFRVMAGGWINNVDVTHALDRFPLAQYGLHQGADGALTLRVHGPLADEGDLRAALGGLFGAAQPLSLERLPELVDKVVQYTSDLAGSSV